MKHRKWKLQDHIHLNANHTINYNDVCEIVFSYSNVMSFHFEFALTCLGLRIVGNTTASFVAALKKEHAAGRQIRGAFVLRLDRG